MHHSFMCSSHRIQYTAVTQPSWNIDKACISVKDQTCCRYSGFYTPVSFTNIALFLFKYKIQQNVDYCSAGAQKYTGA